MRSQDRAIGRRVPDLLRFAVPRTIGHEASHHARHQCRFRVDPVLSSRKTGAMPTRITRHCSIAGLLLTSLLPRPAISQPVLQPPVTPACVSSPFGWRHAVGPHAPAGYHNGIDLPAPAGALVHAAAAGTVEAVRRQGLGGVTVHLRHPGGLVTLYAHLGNLVPAIARGKRNVAAGEPLGHVARTGVTYGTHLFFAVLENGQAVDPLGVLAPLPRC